MFDLLCLTLKLYFHYCAFLLGCTVSFGGAYLSDKDHADIFNKLLYHASEWRDIGGALGFLSGMMDTIQNNPMLLLQRATSEKC